MITQDLINTLTEKREYSVNLAFSAIDFDFSCDDSEDEITSTEQSALVNQVLTDGVEIFRDTRPDPGDALHLDVLQEVVVDQISDDTGWCVNNCTIDWNRSTIN